MEINLFNLPIVATSLCSDGLKEHAYIFSFMECLVLAKFDIDWLILENITEISESIFD